MVGVIERIKNNVLLKCSTLNETVIADNLNKILDTSIYHFTEDIMSLILDLNTSVTEENLNNALNEILRKTIVKKIKRKLFIDSLALQITNDFYIEDYVYKKIDINKISKGYIKELNKNKNSNQLNMTENLDLKEVFDLVYEYFNNNIIILVKENNFLVNSINNTIEKTKTELEQKLVDMIKETDLKYLDILISEINEEIKEEKEDIEGEDNMMEMPKEVLEMELNEKIIPESNKFIKYDDMTLFNKTILSLNTKEEKLSRKESKLELKKKEIEELLEQANKKIEQNIERENRLSQRKLELNSRELELNSKLSEAEVIFLNMKPLINGLNKIKASDQLGGVNNE